MGMLRATVKGVLARRVRLALTALAVVLGVTFVSGTYVLTDTLKQSFGTLFSQYAAGVDLVVRSQAPFGDGDGSRQRLPEGIVDTVRQIPGVGAADGFLQGYAQFVGKDGRTTIQTAGAPTFGISWSGGDQVGPAADRRGAAPGARRRGRDGRRHRAPQRVRSRRPGRRCCSRRKPSSSGSSGCSSSGPQGDFGAVSFAAFDPKTAQRVFDAEGVFDAINVRVAPGTTGRRSSASWNACSTRGRRDGRRVRDHVGGGGGRQRGRRSTSSSRSSTTRCSASPASACWSAGSSSSTRSRSSCPSGCASSGCSGRWARVGRRSSPRCSSRPRSSGCRVGRRARARRAARAGAHVVGRLPRLQHPERRRGGGTADRRARGGRRAAGDGRRRALARDPRRRASRRWRRSGTCPTPGSRPSAGAPVVGARAPRLGHPGAAGRDLRAQQAEDVPSTSCRSSAWRVLLLPRRRRAARDVRTARWRGGFGLPVRVAVGVPGAIARGNAMRNPRRTAATASALVVGLALVAMVAIVRRVGQGVDRARPDDAPGGPHRHRRVHRVLAGGDRPRGPSLPRWRARSASASDANPIEVSERSGSSG